MSQAPCTTHVMAKRDKMDDILDVAHNQTIKQSFGVSLLTRLPHILFVLFDDRIGNEPRDAFWSPCHPFGWPAKIRSACPFCGSCMVKQNSKRPH